VQLPLFLLKCTKLSGSDTGWCFIRKCFMRYSLFAHELNSQIRTLISMDHQSSFHLCLNFRWLPGTGAFQILLSRCLCTELILWYRTLGQAAVWWSRCVLFFVKPTN